MIFQQWSKQIFFRVICYYTNIKMIKFWHNSKTSVQGTVPLGISKTRSFDCVLKTHWHDNNSAYINQGDPRENYTSTPKWQLPDSSQFPLLPSPLFPSSIRKKWSGKMQCCHLFLREKKDCLFESDRVKIMSWFLHRFWRKILKLKNKSSYCSVLKGILLISICQQQNLVIIVITNIVHWCSFCFHE